MTTPKTRSSTLSVGTRCDPPVHPPRQRPYQQGAFGSACRFSSGCGAHCTDDVCIGHMIPRSQLTDLWGAVEEKLQRRHPDSGVQSDGFAVQITALHNVRDFGSELIGVTESLRKLGDGDEWFTHLFGRRASSGVSKTPGATVMTRTPRLPRSRAMGRVMATIPPCLPRILPVRSGRQKRQWRPR